MYYDPELDVVYAGVWEVRQGMKNVCFPDDVTDQMFIDRGVYPVMPTQPINNVTKMVLEDKPVLINGEYQQAWKYIDATPEQIEANEVKLAADLLQAKVAKNTEINKWRATANQSFFTFQDKAIACDALSRSDIDAVATSVVLNGSFPVGFPLAWKAIDNSYIMLPDIDAFKDMHNAMTSQGTANFARSQQLKAALAAATTVEQVALIVWE